MKLNPLLLAASALLAAPVLVAAQEGVSVEIVIAADVVDREPVGAAESFGADVGKVYAWMRVSGAADSSLEVVWTHGPHTSSVPLNIGGSPWRTWSSKTIPAEWTGTWTVEVKDASGTVVATTTFTVN
ncbi:MAG: DUF2914 domain-containing protein [Gemmatimonadota bacterium]|nr:DUF2914 domain-containing protein [Gemmatimonadota bacterium]MDH5759226.1 DUF2914 domain-containing protein [Gemmatimonadota bacterium]